MYILRLFALNPVVQHVLLELHWWMKIIWLQPWFRHWPIRNSMFCWVHRYMNFSSYSWTWPEWRWSFSKRTHPQCLQSLFWVSIFGRYGEILHNRKYRISEGKPCNRVHEKGRVASIKTVTCCLCYYLYFRGFWLLVGNTSASLLLSEKFPVVCDWLTVVADAPVHILETFLMGLNYNMSPSSFHSISSNFSSKLQLNLDCLDSWRRCWIVWIVKIWILMSQNKTE